MFAGPNSSVFRLLKTPLSSSDSQEHFILPPSVDDPLLAKDAVGLGAAEINQHSVSALVVDDDLLHCKIISYQVCAAHLHACYAMPCGFISLSTSSFLGCSLLSSRITFDLSYPSPTPAASAGCRSVLHHRPGQARRHPGESSLQPRVPGLCAAGPLRVRDRGGPETEGEGAGTQATGESQSS